MDADPINWVSSAAVPTPEKGEHFCRWQVTVEVDGVTATASADCDFRDGNAYAFSLTKRYGQAKGKAKLEQLRTELGPTAEAKAKRRALHDLGYTWNRAAEIVGTGTGHA